jgi:transposase
MKLSFWGGTGLCLFAERLEGGKFHWPLWQIVADVLIRCPTIFVRCGRCAAQRNVAITQPNDRTQRSLRGLLHKVQGFERLAKLCSI